MPSVMLASLSLGQCFALAETDMQAIEGADALMVLTEWKNFHNPDFEAMKALMRTPFIVDGRNLYNPQALLALGMAYQGVGRRNALVQGLRFDRSQAPLFKPMLENPPPSCTTVHA